MIVYVSILAATLVSSKQPNAAPDVISPLRPLQFGELNILHSSDTHGWLAGHLLESQYSADWGDYASFVIAMRNLSTAYGADFLTVDTGDIGDGTGLSDATEIPGSVSRPLFAKMLPDLATVGNHALYVAEVAQATFEEIVPLYEGRYIVGNVKIYNENLISMVPFANHSYYFVTENNVRVLALGFLYDMKGTAHNIEVQPVESSINEDWFMEEMQRQDVDLFLVLAHASIRAGREIRTIHQAIRRAHPNTPIQFLGGHTHTRDFRKHDNKSFALESGRYCETLGWVSLNGIKNESSYSVKRRYIDFNRFSFKNHSLKSNSTFDTPLGKEITRDITIARRNLKLDTTFGCAPHEYLMNHAPVSDERNVYHLLTNYVLPEMVDNPNRVNRSRLIFTNSASIRFDIYRGPFTLDSSFMVCPFRSQFFYIKDVTYGIAKQILRLLNHGTYADEHAPSLKGAYQHVHSLNHVRRDSLLHASQYQFEGHGEVIIPGHTTKDDFGADGDNTVHSHMPFFPITNCIQANGSFPRNADPDVVDVVFDDFITAHILEVLNRLGAPYTRADVKPYLGTNETLSGMLREYASLHWKC